MTTLITIILAAITMLALAMFMGFILGWANEAFHVKVDERIENINSILPAANCGGCGYVGCMEYAEAVVNDDIPVNKCTVGGDACAEEIAAIMGKDVGNQLPYRPVIHCAANYDGRLKKHEYYGEKTCRAANLVTSLQGCIYGCLGFGDCLKSCQFGAIIIENGLAKIDYEKCIGCGACSKVCPRNIITLVPFKNESLAVIACSNKDKAKDVRSVCKVGCVGCLACTKQCDFYKKEGENALARLDYDALDKNGNFDAAIAKCPRDCMIYIGKPSDTDKEKVKDEEVPEVIQADFKTTVDDTEWRG